MKIHGGRILQHYFVQLNENADINTVDARIKDAKA